MTERRLNLRVSAEVEERLLRLQEVTGSVSITETIRKALALMEEAVAWEQGGGCVLLETSKGNLERLKILS